MGEYKIIRQIAVIGKKGSWNLELNVVKWKEHPEKLDLRSWNDDHTKCGKGITLSDEEAESLCTVLEEITRE